MQCGLSSVLTVSIIKHTLNVGYDWSGIPGGKHVKTLIRDITGNTTKPYWQLFSQALCRFSLILDFLRGGPCTWAEDMVNGNINNSELFCDCCGTGSLLDYEHISSDQHRNHPDVRPGTWDAAQLLLAGAMVRLVAVRLTREEQPETEWLEAARSWSKGFAAALNALTPAEQIMKFFDNFHRDPDRRLNQSIIHAEGFEQLFGVTADSSLAARIEGTPDQHLLETSALPALAAPSQESPPEEKKEATQLSFGVDYAPQLTARALVKITNQQIQERADEFVKSLATHAKRRARPASLLALADRPAPAAPAVELPPINQGVQLKIRAESQPAAVRSGRGLLDDLVQEADEVLQERVQVAISADVPSESDATAPPPAVSQRRERSRRVRTRSPHGRSRTERMYLNGFRQSSRERKPPGRNRQGLDPPDPAPPQARAESSQEVDPYMSACEEASAREVDAQIRWEASNNPLKHLITTNAPATERVMMLEHPTYHPPVDESWSLPLPSRKVWKNSGLTKTESTQHYGALEPIVTTNASGQTKATPLFPGGTHCPIGSPSWAGEAIRTLQCQVDEQAPGPWKPIMKIVRDLRDKQSTMEAELSKQAIRLSKAEAAAEFCRAIIVEAISTGDINPSVLQTLTNKVVSRAQLAPELRREADASQMKAGVLSPSSLAVANDPSVTIRHQSRSQSTSASQPLSSAPRPSTRPSNSTGGSGRSRQAESART